MTKTATLSQRLMHLGIWQRPPRAGVSHDGVYVRSARPKTLGDFCGSRRRLARWTHPATRFNYDAAGNVIESTDAKGETTTYTFDALGPKDARNGLPDPDGNPSTANDAPVTTWGYDPKWETFAGPPVRLVTSPVLTRQPQNLTYFTTFYEYDALNRQVRAVDPIQTARDRSSRPVTRFGYNAAGDVLWEDRPARQRSAWCFADDISHQRDGRRQAPYAHS